MPAQDWWLFRFRIPPDPGPGEFDVAFGTVGTWTIHYRLNDDSVFVRDEDGKEHFGDSTIIAFAEMLVLWDAGYRRIQRECPDDSGEDWDRGDIVVAEMERAMKAKDRGAFEHDSSLWPTLIFDMC